MAHDGRDKSKNPFVVLDNAGIQQNIKVVEIGNSSEPYVAGYAYIEATGSTYEYLSSSKDYLHGISEVVSDLSLSVGEIEISDYTSILSDISESVSKVFFNIEATGSTYDLISGSEQHLEDILKNTTDISASVSKPYFYVEATGSTYDYVSGSKNNLDLLVSDINDISSSLSILTDISKSVSTISNIDVVNVLEDISSSANVMSDRVADMSSSVSLSTNYISQSTQHVQQLLRLNRATNIYSKIYPESSLYDDSEDPKVISIHEDPVLNPAAPDVISKENYISKAIEVFIQNSTNRNLFLKISYDTATNISNNDYTLKIPPGVIYSSEEKLAHIRHKIVIDEPYEDFHGQIAASITYNTGLNNDLTIGQAFTGTSTLTSIATNVYNIIFGAHKLVSEWYFEGGSIYSSMKVTGQARVTIPSQGLRMYVENSDGVTIAEATTITSTTPSEFNILMPLVPSGFYELKAQALGSGIIGDAVILYADLIKYT